MLRHHVSTSSLLVLILAGAVRCPITLPDSEGAHYTPTPQAPNVGAAEAQAILDRAQAARLAADDAVKIDGSPKAVEAKNVIGSCKAPRTTCMAAFEDGKQVSLVGALAGGAYYLTQPLAAITARTARRTVLKDSTGKVVYTAAPPPPPDLGQIFAAMPDLVLAEDYVKQATEEAKRTADAREVQKNVLEVEVATLNDARKACDQSQTACRGRCDKEPMYCLAMAGVLWDMKPRRLPDAKTFTQRACDAKIQTACIFIAEIDREIQQAASQVEGLWSGVTQAGDDLVQKRHVAENLAKIANRPHLQSQLQTVLAINQAIVTERYCPARKAFVQRAGVVEFQKRAVAHCKEQAPTGQGLSGVEVTLTTECTAAYATPCP
jgi:hypothetical protein